MLVETRCPHCGTGFEVPSKVLAKRTRCTKCGEPFVIEAYTPSPEELAATERLFASHADEADVSPGPPPFVERERIEHQPEDAAASAEAISVIQLRHRPTPKVSRDWPLLKAFCLVLEVLAAIGLLVLVAMLVLTVVAAIAAYDSNLTISDRVFGVAGTLAGFLIGLLVLVFFLVVPQLVRLAIRVEQNTFESKESHRQALATLANIQSELADARGVDRQHAEPS